jgi:Domain of unknown function (DUF4124)
MKKSSLLVTVWLGLSFGLALAPTAGFAFSGRGPGGRGGGGMVRGGGPSGFPQPSFTHGFKGHHGFRPFFPSGVVTVWNPPLYYGYGAQAYYPPPAYYASDYVPPPVYGAPAGGSVAVAPAPPTPSVVHFPNGRYELRGDGFSTPYTWVWILNPLQAPPAAPPAPPREQPTSGNGSPARHVQFYRWTDEQGVVHLTNEPDTVPAKYRTQAKQTPPS